MNVEEFVSALTLEEKAGLCSGADFWHTKAVERLGIPAIKVSDGPHGLRTKRRQHRPQRCHRGRVLPRRVRGGSILRPGTDPAHGAQPSGREAWASGVQVLLGPAVNIKRSPLRPQF